MTRQATLIFLFLAALLAPKTASSQNAGSEVYARIDIRDVGHRHLEQIKQAPGLAWWIELDDQLLVLAPEQDLDSFAAGLIVERLDVAPHPPRLYLLRGARRADLEEMAVDILAFGGRYAVIQARRDQKPALPHPHEGGLSASHQAHAELMPFEPNLALARNRSREASRIAVSATARAWSDEIDEQRWYNDVMALASFNRYTHGADILNARDWLVTQFQAMPNLSVKTESFQVGGTTAFNVIATLTGAVTPDDLYIVGAHYDSISESPGTAAPGGEDNASGCAGVLELARILTAQSPAATVIFICYSGEEQGLHGSVDHASGLVTAGLDDQVKLALNMDMIGYTGDADLDCLLETSSAHEALADIFAAAASVTNLRIVTSFFPFGSDHVPYLNRGMPSLLTIENDWDSYPCYHSTCDLAAEVDLAMGGGVLKMNAAVLAEMMGQSGQIFADGFESGDTTSWNGL